MTTRAEIEKRISYKRKQRDAAVEALDELLKDTVESYSFSDPNGSQNARNRSMTEYRKLIAELEEQIDTLEGQLQGGGIRTFGTNRYAT